MELTTKEALNMLEEIRKKQEDDRWIGHSICVGNSAGKIARALKETGIDVDVELAITLGYIHDIGKYKDFKKHDLIGYEYLKEKGYDEKYYNICLTHSYLNNDVLCTAGGIPDDISFRREFIKHHKYTIEEKIVNLCDLMCPKLDTVYTVDKRLIDIMIRRGAYSNTQYHVKETYKLKAYFDDLLGYNLYELFPEIKENL